uniref:ATP synthase complex subunit 8 n=1 Tax=Cryptorhynchinae sp. 4 ACP-2013 TaxID=1434465 RepID=A0A3G3MEJ0_9CUCU|nr:ATP synthase F0 subunit 8 [Cryptorhynchinae sp. 4 ACP-2013]
MPQMAPMNWLILYIYFIMLFLMIIIFNYFSFMYKPKKFETKKITKKINWKW